ncbi:uncharacterized protein ARMOST_04469 [Armillaria ostoyae]|uniref:Uncharacterized protein n=1 Tax=Armillaria ostoyae TaxID=47428 RepID=A0A284QXE4_ARMOS|nr:uncharacterized protein ARMOST_04469 [Armillaria ostoyae]
MARISTKFVMEYLCQTAFDIRKGPLAQFTLFVVILFAVSYRLPQLESIAFISIYFAALFYGVHVIWENGKEGIEKAAKEIKPNFVKFIAYMEDRRAFFQADVQESKADAVRLCSSSVAVRCLASKQKAEALYSTVLVASTSSDKLEEIESDLKDQETRINVLIEAYSQYRVSFTNTTGRERFEVAQRWVISMNKIFSF